MPRALLDVDHHDVACEHALIAGEVAAARAHPSAARPRMPAAGRHVGGRRRGLGRRRRLLLEHEPALQVRDVARVHPVGGARRACEVAGTEAPVADQRLERVLRERSLIAGRRADLPADALLRSGRRRRRRRLLDDRRTRECDRGHPADAVKLRLSGRRHLVRGQQLRRRRIVRHQPAPVVDRHVPARMTAGPGALRRQVIVGNSRDVGAGRTGQIHACDEAPPVPRCPTRSPSAPRPLVSERRMAAAYRRGLDAGSPRRRKGGEWSPPFRS